MFIACASMLALVTTPSATAASMPLQKTASDLVAAPDLVSYLRLFTPDTFANGFATLVGALLGAMLAYVLQRRFQRSQEYKLALMAGHRLMFTLLQQINTIVLIQRDFVYEHLQNPGRFLAISATPPFDVKKNVLDLPQLSFLLEDNKGRQLLHDFYIAQENYIEAINQWNLRSTFHLERLQPAVAAAGIANGSVITDTAMRTALGDQIYGHAVNATDNCIVSLQRAFRKLTAIKASIRPYLVQRFGSNDFTDFEFPETWGLSLEEQAPAPCPPHEMDFG